MIMRACFLAGKPVQQYGGFRVILELTLTPEVDGTRQAAMPSADKDMLAPLTVIVNTEIDACDRDDPERWLELKTKAWEVNAFNY